MRAFAGSLAWTVGLILAACGQHAPSTSSTDGIEPKHVLLAVMGGNDSCKEDSSGVSSPYGMKLFAPFQKLSDTLRAQVGMKIDFFLSCHNSDAVVHYYASDKPQQLIDAKIEDVPGKLTELMQTGGANSLFIAGHSYGGWLAMKTGLALAPTAKISGLFTIDAISRVDCTFDRPADCTEAPADITTDQRHAIKGSTGSWLNFYETGTFYLHSSEIPEADKNTYLESTHYDIPTEAEVWNQINDRVMVALSKAILN